MHDGCPRRGFCERQLPVHIMPVGTCQLSVLLQLSHRVVSLFAKATVAPKLAVKQISGFERGNTSQWWYCPQHSMTTSIVHN